jgi:hypothetical protein
MMVDTSGTVLLRRWNPRTVHELGCSFITRRVNNGLVLKDQYEEVHLDEVPADAPRCSFCAPRVDGRR